VRLFWTSGLWMTDWHFTQIVFNLKPAATCAGPKANYVAACV